MPRRNPSLALAELERKRAKAPIVQDITLDEIVPDRMPGERTDIKCPEPGCNAEMRLRRGKHSYFYGCQRFPECKGTHCAHQDGSPMGTPADTGTKKLRIKAHRVFDRIWQDKLMTRKDAYAWMQKTMKLSKTEAHISRFDVKACEKLVKLVQKKFPTAYDRIGGELDLV